LSLSEISARIAQIQSLVSPRTPTTTVSSTSSTDFASTLQGALGTSSTGLASGVSGTGLSSDVLAALGGRTARGADGDDLAAWASKFVGTPYVAGGRSPSTGWDCAGFTQWVAQQYGVQIPDVSWQQIKTGDPVASIGQAKPGDLLFFHEPGGHHRDPSPLGVNHVAIYLGDGKMVEAANPRAGTRISTVDSSHLVGIRRIVAPGDGVARTPAQVASASGLRGLTSFGSLTSSSTVPSTGAVAPASSTTGVRPSGSLAPRELVDVLRKAGFSGEGLKVAWAVAMRESHGRPGALGAVNPNGTRDHGLFQLNDIHLGRSIDASTVYDAASNAAAAYRMSRHGTDWSAWGLGHSGWAGHLEQAKPAAYAQVNARFQEWYARFPGA
jgi:cell wall-associated NlpC family hydrolase